MQKALQPKNVASFQRSLDLIRTGKLNDAEKILRVMLRTEPTAIDIRANLAFIAFKRGDYLKACEIYAEILPDAPNDPEFLNRFAVAAMHVGRLDEAEQALLQVVELAPNGYDSWMNLCALAGFQGKDTQGMRYAARALAIRPDAAGGYVNLGSCLQMCNKLDEAAHAFETALLLDGTQLSAIINLGVIAAKQGKDEEALRYFDRAIVNASEADAAKLNEAKFYKSICLLRLSRLKEAWELYDCGFFPSLTHGRSPRRSFSVPQWQGQALNADQTLLCWKEQGVGDELLFLSCLPDAIKQAGRLIVECDARLVSPLSRSFPSVTFRAAEFANDPVRSPVHHDYDFHIPMGSLFGLCRPDIASFSGAGTIIQPLDALKRRYEGRIGKGDGRLKVGICWRSGTLSPERNAHYTSISDWGPIFASRSDADFYSLQYGECEEELLNAHRHFGVHINRWPDIDYKNSFEDLFALASALDMVITVGTAVSTITAAVGTRTVLMSLPSWTSFGTDRFLPFPAVELVSAPIGGQVVDLIPQIAELLRSV